MENSTADIYIYLYLTASVHLFPYYFATVLYRQTQRGDYDIPGVPLLERVCEFDDGYRSRLITAGSFVMWYK